MKSKSTYMSSEIKIGVVCEINDSFLICGGLITDDELILICQLIGHYDSHLTRIPLLHIFTDIRQLHLVAIDPWRPETL